MNSELADILVNVLAFDDITLFINAKITERKIMTNWTEKLRHVGSSTGKLASGAPETMRSFGGMAASVMKDGALDKKTKELMAVSISICIRCEGCIAYHVSNAAKAGATREEIVETITVAVEMGGGPSTVYGAKALEAFDEFAG